MMQLHATLSFLCASLAFGEEVFRAFENEVHLVDTDGEYPWKMPAIPMAPEYARRFAARAQERNNHQQQGQKLAQNVVNERLRRDHAQQAQQASALADEQTRLSNIEAPHLLPGSHPMSQDVEVKLPPLPVITVPEPVPGHFTSPGQVNHHTKLSHVVTAGGGFAKSQSLLQQSKTDPPAGSNLMRREGIGAGGNSLASVEGKEGEVKGDKEEEVEKNLDDMLLDAQSNLAHLHSMIAAEKEQKEMEKKIELMKQEESRRSPVTINGPISLTGKFMCQSKNWTQKQCWLLGCCRFTPSIYVATPMGYQIQTGLCESAIDDNQICDTGSLVTGVNMCENHGFDNAACMTIGCCQFINGNCSSAVGNNYCSITASYSLAQSATVQEAVANANGYGSNSVVPDMSAVFGSTR